jgi:two-component system phosphate regulon response regulator PhoB
MEIVWGYAYDSLQGTVDSHIKTLRKKLGSLADQIETVTGVGYKWVEREED